MPLAMSRMGITLGVSVIVWSGLTAGFGLYLQSRCARYLDRGGASFFALSQITYPNASVIFDAAIAIKCFGVGVSYLIIIGDLMPGVIQGFGLGSGAEFLADRHFWITAFMLVIIPLSFLKRLDSLKYTSVVALVSIGYLVILVVYHFIKNDTVKDPSPIRWVEWEGIIPALSSFPVIVFGYTCHQNMFSILNELADNSHSSVTGVITASIGAAGASYVLTAVTGYLSFGNNVSGNIVSMYAPALSSTIARAAIVVLVMFSVPLQVHPCRSSADAVLRWRPKPSTTSRNINGSAANSPHRHPLLPSRQQHGPAVGGRAQPGMSDARFAVLTQLFLCLHI
ncbi:Amino acid transporter, transmembrane [Ascosphaera apis ARSEF 7405]|uniref:Amino acid transporter, transmembrane n=1 Tax=Ascosphaera apis ARSEF 7405 TaxID=392613 RepID=A0A166PP05_9EURO|nr:Amino acid transporter, transmembrane [Ascosphaera apis ARSEF 7405]